MLAGRLGWVKLGHGIWVLEFSLVEGGASGGPQGVVECRPQQGLWAQGYSCLLKTLGGLADLGTLGDPKIGVEAKEPCRPQTPH